MMITTIVLYVLMVYLTQAHPHDSDAILFPESNENFRSYVSPRILSEQNEDGTPIEPINNNRKSKEIPLDFIQKLNQVDNLSDLLSNYIEGNETFLEHELSNRFGNVERAGAITPKPATCIPTLQTIELKSSNDSDVFYFPSCTRIERCGGCCSHSLLSCQPIQIETVGFQVIVSQYKGGNKLTIKGKEVVFVDKHTKCKCDCKMKQEDCNSFQEYNKGECRCLCTNFDEKKKCEKFNDTKLWDPNVCKCRCRDINECTTGSYFDQNRCSCVQIPMRRRFAELGNKERPFNDREVYELDSLAVAPLLQENNDEQDVF